MLPLLLRTIGTLQMGLGVAYLLIPDLFLETIGHRAPPVDLHYPLAMLGARFFVYGIGLWLAAPSPEANRLWIRLMGWIQIVDLGAGIAFTSLGVVSLSLSAFPMFNAAWIAAVCLVWPVRGQPVAAK